MSESVAKIFASISAIMAEVDPIAKTSRNTQQGYQFRGIDQTYQALQAILAKHGVFTVPTVLEERSEERQSKAGSNLIYRILKIQYRFYASDGSFVDAVVIGEGQDSGDKASNKAMSVAHKYALLQVFCIPTEEPKDPEVDHHELAPRQPVKFAPGVKAAPESEGDPSFFEDLKAPPEERYDPHNDQHKDRMIAQLEKLMLPPRLWDDVGFEMKGKGMNQRNLTAAINKVSK